MDNITNIIYNIKAIDNATTTIQNVMANLSALHSVSNVTITIQHKGTNLTTYTKKIDQLTTALNSVPTDVVAKMHTGDLNVVSAQTNVISTNTEDTSKNVKKVSNETDNWRKKLAKAVSIVSRLRTVYNFVATSLKESGNYIETLHLIKVAYKEIGDEEGRAAREAYNFGKSISDTFGTSITETTKYLSLFRQMTSAIGIANDTANQMSKSLTALGYDIASLYNISIESAMEKLEAGIAGQTKPLRTLGMDITAQSLDNYLKQELKLANITSKQMTQADKMILRTIVIMEQAQNAAGDMAKTINTFSNQVKVLNGALANFKLAVGDLVEKYFGNLVTKAAGVLIAITKIIRVFAPFTDTTETEELANSLGNINDELDEIEEKVNLLSFDKFNALTKNGSSTSNSAITDMLMGVLDQKYVEYMKKFQESMKNIENQANKVADSIIKWVFPNALLDDMGNLVLETGKTNNGLGEINGWLKAIWTLLKTIISLAIVALMNKIPPALIKISKSMALAEKEGNLLKKTIANISLALGAFLLIDTITKWKDLETGEKIARSAGILLCFAIWAVNSGLLDTVKIIATKLIAAFGKLASTILTNVVPAFVKMASTTAGWLLGLGALLTAMVYFISNMDKMSSSAKGWIIVLSLVAAAFTALAVAKAAAAAGIAAGPTALVTAAMIGAAITMMVGTTVAIGKYADGGLPKEGQLFIANEAGPELVASIGGNTAVANNDMIVQAIENAAYRGFIRAIDDTQGTSSSSRNADIVLNINGREFARATAPDMANEFNRRNLKIK